MELLRQDLWWWSQRLARIKHQPGTCTHTAALIQANMFRTHGSVSQYINKLVSFCLSWRQTWVRGSIGRALSHLTSVAACPPFEILHRAVKGKHWSTAHWCSWQVVPLCIQEIEWFQGVYLTLWLLFYWSGTLAECAWIWPMSAQRFCSNSDSYLGVNHGGHGAIFKGHPTLAQAFGEKCRPLCCSLRTHELRSQPDVCPVYKTW